MSENELENGITAVDAGGAVALDDGCCPERGAAAPGHPKKATGGVRQAVILSEATVGSEVEGSRAAPAESVREYEPLAVEGRLGYHFVKRAFDIVFSACATIVGLIPVALLCLVIRLESPGSPIYLQERVGYRGKPLRILKLRTMVADSDDVEKHLSPEQLTQWERERKVDDDPRVTRVGRFLRKTSLDELPQFLNVLAGQIPLRILKTRPEFSEKSMGAFALPAKSSTNKGKVFSQVVSCFANGLRMRRISKFNCNRIRGMEAQFLAKPVFGAVCA
ncbi:sugar transferase [Eggerthella lenta]|uniref:sugar transferase n=1 Tax=Eggerthella lenta TaxID=84112 RepID=UPI00209CDE46|nr:sugar transferase [Eggerthella lenta]